MEQNRQWVKKLHTSLQDDKTKVFNEGPVSPNPLIQDALPKMIHKSLPSHPLRRHTTAINPIVSTGSVDSSEELDITAKIMTANRHPLPLIRHRTLQDTLNQTASSLGPPTALKVPPVVSSSCSQPTSPVTKTVATVKSSLSDSNLPNDATLLDNKTSFDDKTMCSQTSDLVTEADLLTLSSTIGEKLPFLTVQLGMSLSDWDRARESFKLPDTQALYILRLWFNEKERKMSELQAALSECGLAKLTKGRALEDAVQKPTGDKGGKSNRCQTHKSAYLRATSLQHNKVHTPLYSRGFSLQREDGGIKNFVRQNEIMKQRAIRKQDHMEDSRAQSTT